MICILQWRQSEAQRVVGNKDAGQLYISLVCLLDTSYATNTGLYGGNVPLSNQGFAQQLEP